MYEKEEAKEIYIQKIEEYTNTLFDRANLPGGIKVALDRLMVYDPENLIIASQKLHDMSTTNTDPNVVYDIIARDLEPYCRPHLVGDKKKRRYKDGRRRSR